MSRGPGCYLFASRTAGKPLTFKFVDFAETMKSTTALWPVIFCLATAGLQGAPPQRVVSLAPNLTAMIMTLGQADKLAAVTPFCDAPPAIPRITGGMVPDAESVLALEPDLVLATSLTPEATLRQLRQLGLRVQQIDAGTLGEIRGAMSEVAAIMEAAPPPPADSQAPAADRSAVLLFGADTGFSAGPGTHADEILRAAGLRNIASESAVPWPQLGEEFLLSADPDIVIVADYGAAQRDDAMKLLLTHPVRCHLRAVQTGNVVVLPAAAFSVPGPAALGAAAQLRARLERP